MEAETSAQRLAIVAPTACQEERCGDQHGGRGHELIEEPAYPSPPHEAGEYSVRSMSRRPPDESRIPARGQDLPHEDEDSEDSGIQRGTESDMQSLATKDPDATRPPGPTLAYSRSEYQAQIKEATDKELLWAIRHGDERALDELITRKTNPLLKLVYRILNDAEEARDIVQVTFFRLWEKRDRFDDRWSPNTWIYRIATNLAIDQLRSRNSRQKSLEPIRLHLQDSFSSRARRDRASLHEGEVMAIFQELADELTDKQRMVFLLREVEEMPSREVAQIVGCRESTVRNHLFNARKILRRELVARYPEYAAGRVKGVRS